MSAEIKRKERKPPRKQPMGDGGEGGLALGRKRVMPVVGTFCEPHKAVLVVVGMCKDGDFAFSLGW